MKEIYLATPWQNYSEAGRTLIALENLLNQYNCVEAGDKSNTFQSIDVSSVIKHLYYGNKILAYFLTAKESQKIISLGLRDPFSVDLEQLRDRNRGLIADLQELGFCEIDKQGLNERLVSGSKQTISVSDLDFI